MRYLSKKSPPPNPTPSPPTPKETTQLPLLKSHLLTLTTLTQQELSHFTSPATLTRYLRARNHDISKAASMLHSSIQFNRTTPPLYVCPTCVSDPSSHSFFPIGPTYDTITLPLAQTTPIFYSNFLVKDRDTCSVTAHMQSAMHAAFDPQSMHRMVWVMDFVGFSRADVSPTNAKRVLLMFADHFPERLGCAVIYDAPRAFSALWAAVKVFAAPETVAKVMFVREGEESESFAKVGIIGDVYQRVMNEIRLAREDGVKGSWWERSPMPPLVDYGARVVEAAEKLRETEHT